MIANVNNTASDTLKLAKFSEIELVAYKINDCAVHSYISCRHNIFFNETILHFEKLGFSCSPSGCNFPRLDTIPLDTIPREVTFSWSK